MRERENYWLCKWCGKEMEHKIYEENDLVFGECKGCLKREKIKRQNYEADV